MLKTLKKPLNEVSFDEFEAGFFADWQEEDGGIETVDQAISEALQFHCEQFGPGPIEVSLIITPVRGSVKHEGPGAITLLQSVDGINEPRATQLDLYQGPLIRLADGYVPEGDV